MVPKSLAVKLLGSSMGKKAPRVAGLLIDSRM